MLSRRWERIIDALSYINADCIDKEKLKRVLEYDVEVDAQVLDNMYLLHVITLDEYKKSIKRYIDREESNIRYLKQRLKEAEKEGDDYNPLPFYGFGSTYRGAAVQDMGNFEFLDRFGKNES